MLGKKDIEHLSKLARIRVSENEARSLSKDLEAILEYVDQLKEVDISKVSESTHAVEVENVVREDEPDAFGSMPHLIEQAPNSEKGFVKVKAVFEKNTKHET